MALGVAHAVIRGSENPGISSPIFVGLWLSWFWIFAAFMRFEIRRGAYAAGGAALFASVFLAVRDSSYLESFNTLAVAFFSLLCVSLVIVPNARDFRLRDYFP